MNLCVSAQHQSMAFENAMDKLEDLSVDHMQSILHRLEVLRAKIDSIEKLGIDQLSRWRSIQFKKLDQAEQKATSTRKVITGAITCFIGSQPYQKHPIRIHHNQKSMSHINLRNYIQVYKPHLLLDRIHSISDSAECVITQILLYNFMDIAWNPGMKWAFEKKVGGRGNLRGKFRYPFDIAVHPITHRLYVTDEENNRVQVLSKDLDFLYELPKPEWGILVFNAPFGISISDDGSMIMVMENRSQSFICISGDERSYRRFASKDFPGCQLSVPYFVRFDRNSNFYVTDSKFQNINKFDRDCNFVGQFLERKGLGTSSKTWGILVNPENELLCIHNCNNRVQFMDCQDGTVIRSVDIKPVANNWHYLFHGPNSSFGVTDFENSNVSLYSKDGHLLWSETVKKPVGAAFAPDGTLYIVLWSEDMVAMYKPVWS
eukprot:TRINITY_DN7038_c0_g1_i2.p1 TRINITY_DN7038_c0_g1~~TRINITY_DN7038_c0_g1_i2.p1  ORF type:complete len:431 (-),score=62.57 TRINITY_DN7038_c0_g1_i2:74-1366(-)